MEGEPKSGVFQWTGRNVSEMLIVEIFAGTARLSRACRDLGFRIFPVDKSNARTKQMHLATYDLTLKEDVQALKEVLAREKDNILWAHFSPACGTCSRARERPLPKLQKKGYTVARPLRSLECPMGLPRLTPKERARVLSANLTYCATAELIMLLHSWGICCSIENPKNSHFWILPMIVQLLEQCGGFDTIFDNCCHGGTRKKTTRWWCTTDWFLPLAILCQDEHYHEPWAPKIIDGRVTYPTAQEAAYPPLLCQRLAALVKQKFLENNGSEAFDLQQQQQHEHKSLHRFVLNALPRGKQYRQTVSEFGTIVSVVSPLSECDFTFLTPKPRLLERRIETWGDIRVGVEKGSMIMHPSLLNEINRFTDGSRLEICKIGITRAPQDFVDCAVKAGHPRGTAIHLSDLVVEVLSENVLGDAANVAKQRCSFLRCWTKRAQELEDQEASLRERMPEYLKKVLAPKRLVLLQEILQSLGYPDESLVKDIAEGFRLTGWLEPSGIFPGDVKRPQYDVRTLKLLAKGLNHHIVKQLQTQKDEEDIADSTWQSTLEEVEKGYIWFDENCDFTAVALAKRFGLRQRDKVRMIDDCSVGGINKALGTVEKYRIHAIDEFAAYAAWCLDAGQSQMNPKILCGRTYDLKSAYRQYGLHPEDRELIRLAVKKPEDGSIHFCGLNSLPFGAVGSVGGFLRVSLALWFVGLKGLRIPWTAFYDDYTVLTSEELAPNTDKAICLLFDLLGVQFAKDGKKAVEFDKQFRTLGVIVDLSQVSQGHILVGHTQERKEELLSALTEILSAMKVSPKKAESMRGRMHWFESFAYGRIANNAVRILGDLATQEGSYVRLNSEAVRALTFLRDRVVSAPPLKITRSCLKRWYVFTDGACEGDSIKTGSVGGVLVDESGRYVSFFGEEVPASVMDFLLSSSKNPIYELEILPALLALLLWNDCLEGCQVCWYLDNDAARATLIRGSASGIWSQCMISEFVEREMKFRLMSWFSRVPSESNVSDGPSRLDFSFMESFGAGRVTIDWGAISSLFEAARSS